eukprot:99830-Amphidinium_carterae.1
MHISPQKFQQTASLLCWALALVICTSAHKCSWLLSKGRRKPSWGFLMSYEQFALKEEFIDGVCLVYKPFETNPVFSK